MARIIKLSIEATANTTVETQPNVERFFYELTADQTDIILTIDVTEFEDDEGNSAVELPELAANNSYFNVYINGVLQMGDSSSYTAGETGTGQLEVTIPEGETIYAETPVILEVVNYSPEAESDITVNT
ncbi:DUF4183 domain-containing protein [Salipaludibacillus sp. HK11]|uniref:DUF4183 domain-containing protein n=1 Tax=Salipaludibacillus sp. HK11 TaxID=3394320 RepID=UPI0039FD42C5